MNNCGLVRTYHDKYCHDNYNRDDLEVDRKIHYYNCCETKQKGEKLKEEYFQNNNKREGIYKRYYSNGNLLIICNYINGKLNGDYKTYYNSGVIETECNYIEHKRTGIYKEYYDNALLYKEYTYGDHPNHYYKEYNYNGILILEKISNENIRREYYDNGKLLREENENEGTEKVYYRNGNLKIDKSNKFYKKYDTNGNITRDSDFLI